MHTIQLNLKNLLTRIRELEKKYNRPSHAVSLLAVSKGQPLEKIQAAIAAGQVDFGENYLQEALSKIQALQDQKVIWHFIGPLQRNKTKIIAENFSWVHSLANLDIAKRLNQQRPTHLPPLQVCIQVNISEETSKFGIALSEVDQFAEHLKVFPHLSFRGLMTIPKPATDLEAQRFPFQQLLKTFLKLKEQGFAIDTLSMGMSNDMEAAIAEGSTMVRIGTTFFGIRSKKYTT